MRPGRFVGFAWNGGEPTTFKALQCNEDLHNQDIVLHRGVIVPLSLTAIGHNSALAPKSDAYFPTVQVESGATRKPPHSGTRGPCTPPSITIAEGGRKRHKPSSLPPTNVESDRSTAGSIEAVNRIRSKPSLFR